MKHPECNIKKKIKIRSQDIFSSTVTLENTMNCNALFFHSPSPGPLKEGATISLATQDWCELLY